MTAADIEAIRQLKARYFRTLDQKDWSGYRQVFADDVEIDVTDDAADGRYTGTEIYLPMIESLLDTATTVHRGGQAEITVDGDTASGIWAMDDRIWFPGGATLIGSGWYEETYRRAADGWLIATITMMVVVRCPHRFSSKNGSRYPDTSVMCGIARNTSATTRIQKA